jgi:hypothetical protein
MREAQVSYVMQMATLFVFWTRLAYLWITLRGDVSGASSISAISVITISTDGVRRTIGAIIRERSQ